MSYQQIPGLNPSRNLEDYLCAVMMDTESRSVDRKDAYRRVKGYIWDYEAWLDELSNQPLNEVTGPLQESVEADVKKWRAAVKEYMATK